MGVEPKIGGFPQIIHFNRVFHYKPSILGYPYFWKHPYLKFHIDTENGALEKVSPVNYGFFCIYVEFWRYNKHYMVLCMSCMFRCCKAYKTKKIYNTIIQQNLVKNRVPIRASTYQNASKNRSF